jgi:hypothetical protein
VGNDTTIRIYDLTQTVTTPDVHVLDGCFISTWSA